MSGYQWYVMHSTIHSWENGWISVIWLHLLGVTPEREQRQIGFLATCPEQSPSCAIFPYYLSLFIVQFYCCVISLSITSSHASTRQSMYGWMTHRVHWLSYCSPTLCPYIMRHADTVKKQGYRSWRWKISQRHYNAWLRWGILACRMGSAFNSKRNQLSNLDTVVASLLPGNRGTSLKRANSQCWTM